MAKLTKGQIEGIRLLADLFVLDDLTKQVMSTMLTPAQLEQFKQHMKAKCPEMTEAGEELKRQIIDARRVWREELEKDDLL